MHALSIGVTVYWSVLVAEIIGDKTIYTVTSLTMRFRDLIVLSVIVVVYALKMGAAVLLGSFIDILQSPVITMISAAAFFVSALLVAIRRPRELGITEPLDDDWRKAAATCFASLFFTEWGDPGQLVAAAWSAQVHLPLVVCAAGALAMTTKGTVALLVGRKLRGHFSQPLMRVVAAASLCVMGVITLVHGE
jgi:putative Ca2+/H+ antiporter (TMEM165/GDT1 family)